MRIRSLFPLLLLLAVACAAMTPTPKAGRPASIPQPEIEASVVNRIYFGSQTTAAAAVEIRVKNNGTEPITVRRIELDSSMTMEQWGLVRQEREYAEVIGSTETRAINFFGTARVLTAGQRRTEPLSFDVRVELEARDGSRWQELRRVHSMVSPT